MSALWRERIVIGVAPDKLSALRLGRGLRSRIVDRTELAREPGSIDAALADSLSRLLDGPGWRRGTIDVLLANHYVRYAVIPAAAKLKAAADREALARIVFQQTYGDIARDWTIVLDPVTTRHATIASGVPSTVLETFRRLDNPSQRVRAIQPILMGVVNQARKAIGQQSGCLAIVESGRMTLAQIRDGRWHSISSRAVAQDDPAALTKILDEGKRLQMDTSNAIASQLWLCDLTGCAEMPTTGWTSTSLRPTVNGKPTVGIPVIADWALV